MTDNNDTVAPPAEKEHCIVIFGQQALPVPLPYDQVKHELEHCMTTDVPFSFETEDGYTTLLCIPKGLFVSVFKEHVYNRLQKETAEQMAVQTAAQTAELQELKRTFKR
jgi:hypothetical protein